MRLFPTPVWPQNFSKALLKGHNACITSENELTKAGCPTSHLLHLKENAEKVAQVDENSKKFGAEMIEKIWRQMADREKLFLSTPTVENAELELTEALLK